MTKDELKQVVQGQQIAALQTAIGVLAHALETGDPGAYKVFSDRMHFEMKPAPQENKDDDQRHAEAFVVDSYNEVLKQVLRHSTPVKIRQTARNVPCL